MVKCLFTGTLIIQSTEIVTCNSSAVNLSCIIKTGLPSYGFNLWTHSVNGIHIRTLNGSINGMESVLEVETCSYQEAGEYTCNAWNTHGETSLVVNKNISLQVNSRYTFLLLYSFFGSVLHV